MKRTHTTRTLCLLPALLMAAALLPGCQPTPEEEFVVNRLDGALEEAVLATPAPPARYEAPERWTESFDVRGQTVRIDVAIEVPDAVEYPVLTVQNAIPDNFLNIYTMIITFYFVKQLNAEGKDGN